MVCVLSPLLFVVHMNWIDSHSRVDKGVTIGSCKISRFLFANDFVLLAFSEQGIQHTFDEEGLQHALDRFPAVCDQAGMKISSKNTGVLCLSRNPNQCTLQASGKNTWYHFRKFK